MVYVPSVFQTLQTTDPGAEGEPLENHAKVRQAPICVLELNSLRLNETNVPGV